MMFVIAVHKLFPFGIICNTLIFVFVLSSNAVKGEHLLSTNPTIYLNSNKSHNAYNQMNKLLEGNHNTNKNGVSVVPGPSTDSEVLDLTSHSKSGTAVTKTPRENIQTDDIDNVNIDIISEAENKIKVNGRFNPTSGAIAAVTCVSLAVVAYIGIVLWRNVIQRNYENREILLNEDDIGDINDEDMRHFELKLMDKDGRVIEPSRR